MGSLNELKLPSPKSHCQSVGFVDESWNATSIGKQPFNCSKVKLAVALLTIIVSDIMVFLQPLFLILNDITFLPVSMNCIHVESPLPRTEAPDHS